MRIVGGYLGGRRLIAPKGDRVRPTPDRVREALFNILGDLSGRSFLDLFAGTGANGLEAISRGAERVVFVDQDTRLVAENLKQLAVTADIIRGDLAQAIARVAGPFDVIFADPPYDEVQTLVPVIMRECPRLLAETGSLIVEHAVRMPPDSESRVMETVRTRSYGDTALTFLKLLRKDRLP